MGLAGALEPILPFIKGAVGAVTKSVGDMFSWLATHQEDIRARLVDTGNAVSGWLSRSCSAWCSAHHASGHG